MAAYILDASAFLAGVSLCFEGELLIPASVQGELMYGAGKKRLEETILRGGKIVSPSQNTLEDVRTRAKGSDQGLSTTDMEVLAVALENSGTVVSDDYGIQNLCIVFDIPFQPLAEKGVGSHWKWGFKCSGCARPLDGPEDCPVCGSQARRKRL